MAGLSDCASSEEVLARDRETCEKIGFAREPEGFRNCLLALQAARLQAPVRHYRR